MEHPQTDTTWQLEGYKQQSEASEYTLDTLRVKTYLKDLQGKGGREKKSRINSAAGVDIISMYHLLRCRE